MPRRTLPTALVLALCLALPDAARAGGFQISSPDIGPDGRIRPAQVLDRYGCTGANRSPALRWSGVPPGTGSFALTLLDRDARHGAGFWHWIVLDIPRTTRSLPPAAGAPRGAGLPQGARQGQTSFGVTAYGGPCPPRGQPAHHYVLTLYALRVAQLPPSAGADPGATAALLQRDALATARLTATYGRPDGAGAH
jgi:Raf kinase inhibitor-like YbhB/YbcL family protein